MDSGFTCRSGFTYTWAEKTSCSPLRATTTMMRRACQHLQKRTSSTDSSSADGRNPIGAHGRDEDCWHVTSKLKRLLSASHGIARCLRPRETSLCTRRGNCTDQPQPHCDFQCILGINGNSNVSRRRHHSSSISTAASFSQVFDPSEEKCTPHELFQTADRTHSAHSRSQGSGVATAFTVYGACRSFRFKCRLVLWLLASLLVDDSALSNCKLS